jgi:hypothetical protein
LKDWKKLAILVAVFLVAYFLPLGNSKVSGAILEAFRLLQWYAVNHTLACVVPAMFFAGAMGLAVLAMLWRWFSRDEVKDWLRATWDFALMIVPLLFGGVFLTGFIGALIPETYVATLVGGNSPASNFIASFVGAIRYFATLTEIPIVEMLMRLGMGRGPALALLLAGPALSLPSMLVIYKVVGLRKTAVFCGLVVVMAAMSGMIFGAFAE